jgi:pimeloyl-ACP methyl ester carboxylesterase
MGAGRRSWAFVLALVLALTAVLGSVSPAAEAASSSPKIAWSSCFRSFGPFECGTVQVPLDYSSPGAGTVSLAVIRLPAGDPARRIGSLFINPGGPGGSGVDFALFAAPFLFTAEVRARFDIVGFDPRGVARSTALRCFGNAKQWAPYFTPFAFPSNAAEEAAWEASDLYLDGACAQRGGKIIDHMATANVARDLDILRAAVGDAQITYAGYSYGSYLGVTYANLFPDRVRALLVDGVLDPIAWSTCVGNEGTTVPFSTRLRSDQGAQATLDEFFRLCDAGVGCAFAPNSAERFDALADRLKTGPIDIVDPATGQVFQFNYSLLILQALIAMYDSVSWPDLAVFLAGLEASASAAELGASLNALDRATGFITKRGFPNYRNNVEAFPAIACADSDNPDSYAAWSQQGALADATFGYFGRIWTWVSSICAKWPGSDGARFVGPFTRTTANPVLVIGNHFDPATRYQGAVTVDGLLPSSALLTVHGWGHTSLFLSACADAAVSDYLVRVAVPASGTVCEQDLVPFDAGAARGSNRDRAAKARARAALVPSNLAQVRD